MKKFTRVQIENAIDKFIEWFPEESDYFISNRELIIHQILDNPPEVAPILLEANYSQIPESLETETKLEISPCEMAIGVVVVDVVLFALGLVGLHVSNQERLSRALIREIGPSTLRGFARAIHNFSVAEGKLNKAKALFAIMGGIWKAGGFKAAFKVLKHEMSFWDWTKTGLIATVQIIAWFATDGAAFIAEAALSIMSAEQLIEDAVKVGEKC